MVSDNDLKKLYASFNSHDERTDILDKISNELETLDLVWLWLHNYPLSDSGKQQIKEWFEDDK